MRFLFNRPVIDHIGITRSVDRRSLKARIVLVAGAAAAGLAAPAAAQSIDLGTATATDLSADSAVGTKAPPGTAPAIAPSQTPLSAVEPMSIVSDKYIQDFSNPNQNYSTLLRVVPSVISASPNGPGGSDGEKIYMRGFADGQYNETFDGIPFGDTNDFTHHSTAFFPSGTIGSVTVDRGPGYADTIGYATFGGTIALHSKEVEDKAGGTLTGGIGSFSTDRGGATAQSGYIAQTGTKFLIDGNGFSTRGELQDGTNDWGSIQAKIEQRLGDRFVASLYGNYTKNFYYNINQPTNAQVAAYGINYAELNNNPLSQQYYPWNQTHKATDFEYLGVKGDLDYFQVDNKLYTYYYYNKQQLGSTLTTVGNGPLGVTVAGIAYPTDVLGINKFNGYRTFGDISEFSSDVKAGWASGTAKAGVWIETQSNRRWQYNVDATQGGLLATTTAANNPATAAKLDIHSSVFNAQPFVQYEWSPIQNLTIVPGYKHVDFSRRQDAAVEQTTLKPTNYHAEYHADLPFLQARYRVTPEASVYAEAAEGFLAPNVNVLYVNNPSANTVAPQQTWNYQTGAVWKASDLTASVDLYEINFSNLITSFTNGGQTYFTNQGGADYYGVETEATYMIGHAVPMIGSVIGDGWALYGNWSLNRATVRATGYWLPNAPDMTAVAGILYDKDNFFGSVLTKYTGQQYTGSGQAPGNAVSMLHPYWSTDLTTGVRVHNDWLYATDIKFEVGVTNVFNDRSPVDSNGNASAATVTYEFNGGRAYFGQATVKF